ncbi:MAG: NERD domain-containing protein [Promethearchaeota archaeon]
MHKLYSEVSLKQFFTEIYKIIRGCANNVIEIWCQPSEISFFKKIDNSKLCDFIEKFEFIYLKRGNYTHYIVINKILFILESIKFLQFDIKRISEILDYNGFEKLIKEILSKNEYRTVKNFRFSDKSNFKSKTLQKRYEVDVIGIYSKYVLIIDAKQWKRKDIFNSLNEAANLQLRRVLALKQNPEVFSNLIMKLFEQNVCIKNYLPFILIPLMVTIEDNHIKLNDNQVPLVSIYEFNSFLQELPYNLRYFKTVQINKITVQRKL